MTAFPRVVLPVEVTDLELPGPFISKSQSGKLTARGSVQIGRSWRESYLVNTRTNEGQTFLAKVRQLWRNGTIFDIYHVDYQTLKGTGGGSPVVQASAALVSLPENLGAWTDIGTPVLTSGQSDPFGGTAAYLLDDNSAAALEGKYLVVAFTGAATKCVAMYIKQGSSTVHLMALRDITAATYRAIVTATWTAGVPALAVTSGSATLYTPEQHPIYTDWWRVSFAPASVVAANSNAVEIYPVNSTVGLTGTGYFFGVNAWNEVSPARYTGPSATGSDAVGDTLYVNGGTASTSNWLRAGDLFSVPVGAIRMVLEAAADVSTQANGYAAIPISPPLFTGGAPADNAALTLSGVTMRAMIVAPPTFPTTSGTSYDYGELSVQFGEAL